MPHNPGQTGGKRSAERNTGEASESDRELYVQKGRAFVCVCVCVGEGVCVCGGGLVLENRERERGRMSLL